MALVLVLSLYSVYVSSHLGEKSTSQKGYKLWLDQDNSLSPYPDGHLQHCITNKPSTGRGLDIQHNLFIYLGAKGLSWFYF